MTTVTTITAATPGNGIVSPAQGGGNAVAGFEALLAAFFGEPTAVAPAQGVAGALTPAPVAPMFLNGDVAPNGEATLGAETLLRIDAPLNAQAAPTGDVEASLVADIMNALDPDTAKTDQDQTPAAVDPTLLIDVAALVAQPIVAVPTQAAETAPTPALTQTAPTIVAQPTTKMTPASASAETAEPAAASASATPQTASSPVGTQATPAAPANAASAPAATDVEPAADQPAATTAQPAAPTGDVVATAANVNASPEAPAQAPAKAKAPAAPQASPPSRTPARASAPAQADHKVQVETESADTAGVEVTADADPALPAQAKNDKTAATLYLPEPSKAPVAQARTAQAPAATAATPPAPVAEADLREVLPAAAFASAAAEAATTETAPEQTAAPAPTGAAQDVATAVAGRTAVAAARPRDAKVQPKTEPQPAKADAKDAFLAVAADVHKAAPAAAAHRTAEAPARKETDAETTAAAPAASAHVEDAHGHVAEDRSAEGARAPSTAPHTAHPVRGSPETVANLAAQIIKKLNGKATRFDIELTPGGMGTVDVRIEIQNGRVTAAMIFDNPQAAAELKARAAELQRSLEQAGFDLSNGGLSFEARDGEAGRGWRQAQDQNEGRGMRGKAFQNAFDTANEAADIAESGALRLRRGASSSLDVRV